MADAEKIRRMMMKAFDAVARGEGLDGVVYDDMDLGREMVIGRALTFGEGLSEDFNDLEFEIVARAFERCESTPPSRRPRDCCAGMLRMVQHRSSE